MWDAQQNQLKIACKMWVKKGLLLDINKYKTNLIHTHASIPFCVHIKDDFFKIFFSCRNKKGQSIPYSIDAIVDNGNISLGKKISAPLLNIGKLGTFDDNGIMPSSFVWHNNKLYMYYIGWNPQVTVSYRLSIGLAISENQGKTFEKYSIAPICDRAIEEPYFNTAPFVLIENNMWKMWYISCTAWKIINDHPEPSYHVKYAESLDGVHWLKKGIVCIDYDQNAEAIGRPCVIKKNNFYEMYFSYRSITNYRSVKGKGYKLGKAISTNGIDWNKVYSKTGIELSDNGWDSQMMEYSHVFIHKGIEYMIYNGNNFGIDGFGYATK